MALVKTDFCDIRKAKITLHELSPMYYHYTPKRSGLNLDAIAEALYDIDYDFLSPNGESITTLSQVVPVGYKDIANHQVPRWLVIDLTEVSKRHESHAEWEEFLAKATAKIIQRLALSTDDRMATVDYENHHFVVGNDYGSYDESDFISV